MISVIMCLCIFIGVGGIKYLDKKKKKIERFIAWYFIAFGICGMALSYVEFCFICFDCQAETLVLPEEDRDLSPEDRMAFINNPVSDHVGILDDSCVLINFSGGGYEHTVLEKVNRFTECCRPGHYYVLVLPPVTSLSIFI